MQNAEQALYHLCAKVKPNSPRVCSAKTQPAHTLYTTNSLLARSNTDLLGAFCGTHTPSQTEACFNNVFIYFFFISPLQFKYMDSQIQEITISSKYFHNHHHVPV